MERNWNSSKNLEKPVDAIPFPLLTLRGVIQSPVQEENLSKALLSMRGVRVDHSHCPARPDYALERMGILFFPGNQSPSVRQSKVKQQRLNLQL